jgi:hypothetical protein
MTKKQMIKQIQKMEAELFLALKESEALWGTEHTLTRIDRSRWASIHNLMKELGIEFDFSLPDADVAFGLIRERINKEQVVEDVLPGEVDWVEYKIEDGDLPL